MSVYVDQPVFPFGNMMMCHLWADTEDELLAMVDTIRVQRKWIQGHPTLSFGKHRTASWVHFDIAKGKRALAIKAGAIETDRYGASYFVAQRTGRTAQVTTIEAMRLKNGRSADGILTEKPGMSALAFVIVATDSAVLLSLHAADFTASQAAAIAHIILHRGQDPRSPEAEPVAPGPTPAPQPSAGSLLSQAEIAAAQGFAGDSCSQCFGFRMLRTGTCLACQECGATTGCA